MIFLMLILLLLDKKKPDKQTNVLTAHNEKDSMPYRKALLVKEASLINENATPEL